IGGSLVDGWTDNYWDPFTVLRVTGKQPEDALWLLKAMPRGIAFRCAVVAIDPAQLRETDCPVLAAKTILSLAKQVDSKRPFPCGIVELMPDRASSDQKQDAKRLEVNQLLRRECAVTINAEIVAEHILIGTKEEEFRLSDRGYQLLSRLVFDK